MAKSKKYFNCLVILSLTLMVIVVSCTTPEIISATPTPLPPGPEAILPEASRLCGGAFNSNTNKDDQTSFSKGSVFSLLTSGEGNDWQGGIPALPYIGATNETQVRYLLCVKETNVDVGSYTDGSTANRLDWSVKLIRYPDGNLLRSTVLTGGEPPISKVGSKSASGTAPKSELLNWLGLSKNVFFHNDNIGSVAFSPDGKILASGSSDIQGDGRCAVNLWDVVTGGEKTVLSDHSGPVAFSPDGKWLATCNTCRKSGISLWEVDTGQKVRVLGGGEIKTLAFSPDGQTLASGSRGGMIRLWNTATGNEIHKLTGHTGDITKIVYSPDGSILASASFDNTVKVWDLENAKEIRTIKHSGWVYGIAISPNSKMLASNEENGIVFWDIETGQQLKQILLQEDTIAKSLAFSPNGSMLAAGKWVTRYFPGTELLVNCISLYNMDTGQETTTFCGHTASVNAVVFSPDGKLLASGGSDDVAIIWDVDLK